MKKYEWLASESGPKNYPMKILRGDFLYPDEGGLYIPNGSLLHGGWGNKVSTHVVGSRHKPLPNRMLITFFSYTEDTFYEGSFDLPYEKISSLFEKGYYSPKMDRHRTYDEIIAGVAPGGIVAVWLYGNDRRTEVFFGKAQKVDIPWERFLDNPEITREDFVRIGIESALKPEALKALDDKGVPYGLWDRYHIRYNWELDINAENPPGLVELVNYYNGEKGYLNFPEENTDNAQYRAIPVHLDYIWIDPKGQGYGMQYHFDETEIFAAFDKLAPGEGEIVDIPLRLETRIDKNDKGYFASAWLHNSTDSIRLEKTNIIVARTSRRVE